MVSSAKYLIGLQPPNSEAILFFGSVSERNSMKRFSVFFEDCEGQTIVGEIFSDAHFEQLRQFKRGESLYLLDFFVLPMKDFMERVPFRYSIKILKTTNIEPREYKKEYKKGVDWQPTIFNELKDSEKHDKRDAFYVEIISVGTVKETESKNEEKGRAFGHKTRICVVRDVNGHEAKLKLKGQFINHLRPTDEGKFVDLYSINVEDESNTENILFFGSPGLFEVDFC